MGHDLRSTNQQWMCDAPWVEFLIEFAPMKRRLSRRFLARFATNNMNNINSNSESSVQGAYPEQGPLNTDKDNQTRTNQDTALENNTAPAKRAAQESNPKMAHTKTNTIQSKLNKVTTQFRDIVSGCSEEDARQNLYKTQILRSIGVGKLVPILTSGPGVI